MISSPAPAPRSSGPSGAAILLLGVILGGVVGGAAATVIIGRAPEELVQVGPAPSAIPTTAPINVVSGSDTIVDVVRDLLPAVVNVVDRTANGTEQVSRS